MLHNPAYASAYAYGRKAPDPTVDNGPQWQVLIHDHYPGYITWATFQANQVQLKANLANFLTSCSGVARQGASLLQGIIICHHCGLHMRTEYRGIRREPIYICSRPRIDAGSASCQLVWGKLLDAEVEKLVLSALEPDQIAIALAAHEKQEQETATLARQWELRIERIRYETDRIRRQYDQVEPENRLVARSLETAWEEKLHQLERVEREYAAWQHQQMTSKQSIDRSELMALAENFPALWRSASNKDKKEIIRLLVSHVIVEQDREQGKVWFQVNWQTGAISQHWYVRIVGNYDSHAYKDALQKRLHELAEDHLTAPEIARVLNDEGYETAHRKRFTPEIVNQLRYKWGIPSLYRHARSPDRWPDGSYSVNGAAKILGISAGCLRKRIEKGHVRATQRRKGASLHVFLTSEEIAQHKK
jgi:hypothetical protein